MPPATEKGPLSGIRIVELASIGPAPFGVMLLADMGAEVVRIERADVEWPDLPVVSRGRASITLDLKAESGREAARRIIESADVLVEGFRPGVTERLGLGPDALLGDNPRLVYARMTGWGQDGPLAKAAGHDLNFIGLTGMLDMLSHDGEPPRPPQNLLGDYGAGGLYLALGVVAALVERARSGRGQIVDAAIVDGAVSMLAPIIGMVAAGVLPDRPADGMLGGDALFYRSYRCADGRFIAVGALEAGFRRVLTDRLMLAPDALDDADNGAAIEALFATRCRDEWIRMFEGSDCCLSPVLDLDEAMRHPHLAGRGAFVPRDGLPNPAPAPRFSRTPGRLPDSIPLQARLRDWGVALAQPGQ